MDSATGQHKRPVIILGMDRSGTSLVANLVHEWGAYGGDPDQLSTGNDGNVHGYWENELLGEFNCVLSRAEGVPPSWDRGFVPAIIAKAEDPQWRDVARGLVAMLAAEDRIWFWKEPHISVYLPFWKRIWGEATYVVPVRNPHDSAVSWQDFEVPEHARDEVSTVAATLLRWQATMLSVLAHTEGSPSRIFVPYEELMGDPVTQCRRLCDFLSDAYSQDRLGDDDLARVAGVVDPTAWRNRSSTPFDEVDLATPAQRDLYRMLLTRVDDPDAPFDATRYPMYPGWREYLSNLEVLTSMLYDQMEVQPPHRTSLRGR